MSSSIMNVFVNHNVKYFVPYERNFTSSLKHTQWVMLLTIAYVFTSRVHGLSSETLQDEGKSRVIGIRSFILTGYISFSFEILPSIAQM